MANTYIIIQHKNETWKMQQFYFIEFLDFIQNSYGKFKKLTIDKTDKIIK